MRQEFLRPSSSAQTYGSMNWYLSCLDTSFIKEHLENKYSFFVIFPEDPFDIQMIPTITLIDFMMLLLFVNCAICSEWLMAF